jgi:hypothetical protein
MITITHWAAGQDLHMVHKSALNHVQGALVLTRFFSASRHHGWQITDLRPFHRHLRRIFCQEEEASQFVALGAVQRALKAQMAACEAVLLAPAVHAAEEPQD